MNQQDRGGGTSPWQLTTAQIKFPAGACCGWSSRLPLRVGWIGSWARFVAVSSQRLLPE